MNEQYGIELQLITNKFNQKIQEVKNKIKGVENEKITPRIDTAEIRLVKIRIQELLNMLEANSKKSFMSSRDVLKTEVEIDKLTEKLKKLNQVNNSNSIAQNRALSSMSSGFNKMTSKIRKFGLSLLSLRTIYSLLSRASSAYLSQDEELANKMQATWIGLGAMLAPVIEVIVNTLLKGIMYINVFVKALTGVDLLSKAITKSMNTATKSAKSLHKALGGFDELYNLDSDSGGIGGGLGGLADAFNNLELNPEKINAITKFANKVKEIKDTLQKEWKNPKTWLTGSLPALLGIKEKDFLKQGVLPSLLGFKQSDFNEIFSAAPLKIAIKNNWKEIKSTFFTGGGEIYKYTKELWGNLNFSTEEGALGLQRIDRKMWEAIKQTAFNGGIELFFLTDTNWKEIGTIFSKGSIVNTSIIQTMWNNMDRIMNTPFGMSALSILISNLDTIKNKTSNLKSAMSTLWSWLQNHIFTVGGISAISNNFETLRIKAGNLLNKLKEMWNWLSTHNVSQKANTTLSTGALSSLLKSLPSYDVGTNYVPNDQIALIHKGEAVVPKKFNTQSNSYINNGETNSLLHRVIEAVENIKINPYVTVKDVGQASVNYINQQKRITGKAVV